jgi:uncharacterized protein YecE (DUF72 family)
MAVLVGTASWTDPEFMKAGWYPPAVKGDAAARLRYYAERFTMVEVNATFYALPSVQTVTNWTERTPEPFRFVVKAHQVISGHRSDPARLPAPLRELPFATDRRGRIVRPSRALRDAVIDTLLESLGPMGAKLEAVLLQLPPSVAFGEDQQREVARIIARFAPVRVAVEFRHRSWVTGDAQRQTMAMLAERDAAYVCVDAPRIAAVSAMPPIVEVTCPELAYLRLHGRNGATWQGSGSVAERFNYVYPREELEEWLVPVLEMAEHAQAVAVVFNNNARDYALRNAAEFQQMLVDRRSALGPPPEGSSAGDTDPHPR